MSALIAITCRICGMKNTYPNYSYECSVISSKVQEEIRIYKVTYSNLLNDGDNATPIKKPESQ
jgi:hypothetical protein